MPRSERKLRLHRSNIEKQIRAKSKKGEDVSDLKDELVFVKNEQVASRKNNRY